MTGALGVLLMGAALYAVPAHADTAKPRSAVDVIAEVQKAYASRGPVQEEIRGETQSRRGIALKIESRLALESPTRWSLRLRNSLGHEFTFELEGRRARKRNNLDGDAWHAANTPGALLGSIKGTSAALGGIASWSTPLLLPASSIWVSRLSELATLQLRGEAKEGEYVLSGSDKRGTATIWIDAGTHLIRRVRASTYGEQTDIQFFYESG